MDHHSRRRTPEPARRARAGSALERRAFLCVAGATTLAAVAGCLGRTSSPTLDHPAAADLAEQPWLGDRAPEAERLIVVFEDPSCPVCRVFEERTFPTLREELVEPGRVAFVSRGYPVAAPWGEPGLDVLEATFVRDEAAFWGLRAHLFAEQGETVFSIETLDRATREYLAAETDLDAGTVLHDAEAGRFDAAVQRDARAAREAGVRGTPTFFLFEDDEYLTKIEGAPSYDLLVNAMGVTE